MLQAAIIGCGVIASAHRNALLLDGRADIRWACDTDITKARDNIPTQRYSEDYREALADPIVDLVCICTPHALHCTPLTEALAAGKHVICEKPLGTSPDQLRLMINAAEAAGKRGLMVTGIFQHRFNPLVVRLRDLLRAGDFGAIREARMDFHCTRTAEYYRSASWRGTWAGEGGALLINQAIHTIDVVNWLSGQPEAVSGIVTNSRLGSVIECEDQAEFSVRYKGGHKAFFNACNDGEGKWITDIHVRCARGSFSLGKGLYGLTAVEHPSQVVKAEVHAYDRLRDELVKLDGGAEKSEYGSFHALQITDAIGAIIGKRAPKVSIADAAVSPEVVHAVYHSSANDGVEVRLPLAEYQHPILSNSASVGKGL